MRCGRAPRRFEAALPFEEAEFEGCARHADNPRNQVRPIGTRKPVHGLHDMLGNVAELTADLFQAALGPGEPGGLAVRGGSASTGELRAACAQLARPNAAVPTSGTAASIPQSSQPIREVLQELERLGRREPRLADELVAMQRRLQQAEALQDREIRTISGDLVAEATRSAAIVGRNHCRLGQARATALPAAERLARVSAEHQGQHRDPLRQLEERGRK